MVTGKLKTAWEAEDDRVQAALCVLVGRLSIDSVLRSKLLADGKLLSKDRRVGVEGESATDGADDSLEQVPLSLV